jgi:hypothetical protein
MNLPRTALAAGAALLLLAVLFGRNPHPHVWWEAVPVYGAVFGYAGAWALIWLAKSILAPLLRRGDQGERP